MPFPRPLEGDLNLLVLLQFPAGEDIAEIAEDLHAQPGDLVHQSAKGAEEIAIAAGALHGVEGAAQSAVGFAHLRARGGGAGQYVLARFKVLSDDIPALAQGYRRIGKRQDRTGEGQQQGNKQQGDGSFHVDSSLNEYFPQYNHMVITVLFYSISALLSIYPFGYFWSVLTMACYRRIRDLREDHDLTQNQVAGMLGMKQPQYFRYEQGYRDIPTDILIKLADIYQTSVDYLLGRTNNPKMPD